MSMSAACVVCESYPLSERAISTWMTELIRTGGRNRCRRPRRVRVRPSSLSLGSSECFPEELCAASRSPQTATSIGEREACRLVARTAARTPRSACSFAFRGCHMAINATPQRNEPPTALCIHFPRSHSTPELPAMDGRVHIFLCIENQAKMGLWFSREDNFCTRVG